MTLPNEYIVMGEDGKEYGPVSAKQIRQWVSEGRAEKKTPVKPDTARDWIFLGDLREFQDLFHQPRTKRSWMPPRKGLVKALAIVAAVAVIYFFFQHFHLLQRFLRH